MKLDIFFSICQTVVKGYLPSERQMFQNFFDQLYLAESLGFGVAWIAETHLSCQVQKRNPGAVIPHFEGEIGLNTDILQMAHLIFERTRKIHVGSAIRNILCNGGPIAHAEAIRMFLTLHSLRQDREERDLHIGFAAGRFPFSNIPYGIVPRDSLEESAWPVVRSKIFLEATEIFLRALRGEVISSADISPQTLSGADFRDEKAWQHILDLSKKLGYRLIDEKFEQSVLLNPRWVFDPVGVVPLEALLNRLRLVVGSHDPSSHILANKFLPCGVFNLSITPDRIIEETHERMKKSFHASGGTWTRSHMPRTALVFIDEDSSRAQQMAREALENYWKALEGTLDPRKVEQAVGNALVGRSEEIIQQLKERFHPEDRLMLWFDFNNHDNQAVQKAMTLFMEKVAPHV